MLSSYGVEMELSQVGGKKRKVCSILTVFFILHISTHTVQMSEHRAMLPLFNLAEAAGSWKGDRSQFRQQ